jgi:hypothetical protein
VGFLVTLNLVNPDAFIARQNLARYEATGKLDVYYLTWLSDDALPVLVDSAGQLAGEQRRTLEDHLRARLSRMQEDAGWRRWPAFHLARWRAYRVLEAWKDG